MYVLGLNFGHDAAATVIKDGEIVSYILRERFTRVKHAVSLDEITVINAIKAAGIEVGDIGFVAITSSQGVELVFDRPDSLSVEFSPHPSHVEMGGLYRYMSNHGVSVDALSKRRMASWVYDTPEDSWVGRLWRELFPEYSQYSKADLPVIAPYFEGHLNIPQWQSGAGLSQIRDAGYFRKILDGNAGEICKGFYYPVSVRLFGRLLPGYYVDHHACHAASVFFQSPYEESAILTHDGAGAPSGSNTGMFYFGVHNKIFPLTPHFVTVGDFYHNVGRVLGLGRMGAPGKLMGLAAYGNPRFFDSKYVGNYFDISKNARGKGGHVESWISECIKIGSGLGYDVSVLGAPDKVTERFCVDIAASAQKIFEETMYAAQEVLWEILFHAGRTPQYLCLSGGTALNCPSNSKVFLEGKFKGVFVEPGCDDSGLAIGAALYVYHDILENDRSVDAARMASPYLGIKHDVSEGALRKIVTASGLSLEVVALSDASRDAAERLADNQVVGWFEGRSEAGPRALGHRSILADPRHSDNWLRVNQIKSRESWRPFAPVVLEAEAGSWFRGAPVPAPYMLFNAQVGAREIPAVTHVDGTARIQTVTESAGGYFDVLKCFFEITGVPVLMNTSFNGPAEPIVETPDEAISFFSNSGLDVLYIDGVRLTRKS